MKIGQFVWISVMFFIISILQFSTAPPNPIPDNESDESEEANSYKYPDFDQTSNPYWLALSEETKENLRKHDHLELNVLKRIRNLDFKLRVAWTGFDDS